MSIYGRRGVAPLRSGLIPGGYYTLGEGVIIASAAVAAADRLMLYMFDVEEATPVAALFARVAIAGAGSAMKAGIWRNVASRPTGLPIIADNVGMSCAATGPIEAAVAGIIPRGRWWAGAKCSATLPTMIAWHGSAIRQPSLAGAATATAAINNGATNQAGAYHLDGQTFANDLPDLTGAAILPGATGCPVLGVKVAA